MNSFENIFKDPHYRIHLDNFENKKSKIVLKKDQFTFYFSLLNDFNPTLADKLIKFVEFYA